ncbi:unannotated protein [freshwater metagenome]|uniref:Unannotated protein n=1 Tax=freshwater metagenome TaxID=449393 RepID=A0A6J7FWK6_9ZZZZ|nr:hypothetical protein [Actinomycetota bacterium]
MPSRRPEAERALSRALVEVLADRRPDIAQAGIDGTHTRRFQDNLVPALTLRQIEAIRRELGAGAGGELRPHETDRRPREEWKRKAHAAYSSSALAASAFGWWKGREEHLELVGLSGFREPLQVEWKRKIAIPGGGTANLDAYAAGDVVLGVESKLTEYLDHKPTAWRDPYFAPQALELLDGPWQTVLARSLRGDENPAFAALHTDVEPWTTRYLDVKQLLKHAMALRSTRDDRPQHLLYVFWEPDNDDEIPEVAAHRAELLELETMLAGAELQFHAVVYSDLWSDWEQLRVPHVDELLHDLRARYVVSL